MKKYKPIVILIKLARESMLFAYHAISVNKLRTFLSLFGITIGIFAIISVFTILDSLEKNVRESIQSLGDNVVYVQKWPWGGGNGEYAWWKYMNRPQPNIDDLEEIRRKSNFSSVSTISAFFRKPIKYSRNEISEGSVMCISSDYEKIRVFDVEKGRYFSSFEVNSGKNSVILGYDLANDLFQGSEPVGKYIKIAGNKFQVIGVFKKEGKNAIGENSHDNLALIPLNYARMFVDLDKINPWIMVKSKDGVQVEDLIDELRGILRSAHRLKPLEEDNFALNQISLIKQGIDAIFKMINFAGGFIAFFSIIVGGFGIANIMFVSVRERTSIIGIQKALGAKRYFIMIQFLYEAVLLAIAGGIIGLVLIFLGTIVVNITTDFTVNLTIANIIRGLLISGVIGIISGFVPAWMASRLSPVEAINTKG